MVHMHNQIAGTKIPQIGDKRPDPRAPSRCRCGCEVTPAVDRELILPDETMEQSTLGYRNSSWRGWCGDRINTTLP
jgi:hypothetical protein